MLHVVPSFVADTDDNSMADVHLSTGKPLDSMGALPALTTANGEDEGDDDLDLLDDAPAPMLSRGATNDGSGAGGRPMPHPFRRSASSTVDAKVDDWVRTSRQRLLADASVDHSPAKCRALIVYKPLPLAGVEGDEAGGGCGEGGLEGGGDPTPSPRTCGDDGGETAVGSRAQASARSEQCPGSSTAEATGSTGGGESNGHVDGGRAPGSFLASPRGLCTAPSGGDDAGGAMSDASERGGGSADSMEMAMDGDEEDGVAPWQGAQPPELPALTRVGTSRGAPTPTLTPEWAAQARVSPGFQNGVLFSTRRRGVISSTMLWVPIGRGRGAEQCAANVVCRLQRVALLSA